MLIKGVRNYWIKKPALGGGKFFCGERGIRTPGGCYTPTVFKTAAIDHSAISPGAKVQFFCFSQTKNWLWAAIALKSVFLQPCKILLPKIWKKGMV